MEPLLVLRIDLGKSLAETSFKLAYQTDFQGIPVSIENRKGSIRRGVDKDGKPWETKMHFAYGRIPRSRGVDKDQLDIYLGPRAATCKSVFIVHQNDPKTGKYDEDKILAGWLDAESAKKAYLSQYNNPKFFGSMSEMPIERFKELAKESYEDPRKLTKAFFTRSELKDWGNRATQLWGKTHAPKGPERSPEGKCYRASWRPWKDESNMKTRYFQDRDEAIQTAYMRESNGELVAFVYGDIPDGVAVEKSVEKFNTPEGPDQAGEGYCYKLVFAEGAAIQCFAKKADAVRAAARLKDALELCGFSYCPIPAYKSGRKASVHKSFALKPWIGVDLDGTLAEYHGYKGPTDIGDPIPAMVDRVKRWLSEGKDVRIFTARAGASIPEKPIKAWCVEHLGRELPITNVKDQGCIEIWDDRAVRVKRNDGQQIKKSMPGEKLVIRFTVDKYCKDGLLNFLSAMKRMHDIGHSANIKLYVDGDGRSPDVEMVDGELPKISDEDMRDMEKSLAGIGVYLLSKSHIKAAEREGGQVLMSQGSKTQGAAGLSDFPSSPTVAEREGGQVLVTKGNETQGAAGLPALTPSQDDYTTSGDDVKQEIIKSLFGKILLLSKSHVKGHYRKDEKGDVFWVRPYDDKRTKSESNDKPEKDKPATKVTDGQIDKLSTDKQPWEMTPEAFEEIYGKPTEVVHYSKSYDFTLEEVEPGGGLGAGIFFYPVGEEVDWEDRTPHYFYLPKKVAEDCEYQSFEADEMDGVDHRVTEIFVPSDQMVFVSDKSDWIHRNVIEDALKHDLAPYNGWRNDYPGLAEEYDQGFSKSLSRTQLHSSREYVHIAELLQSGDFREAAHKALEIAGDDRDKAEDILDSCSRSEMSENDADEAFHDAMECLRNIEKEKIENDR